MSRQGSFRSSSPEYDDDSPGSDESARTNEKETLPGLPPISAQNKNPVSRTGFGPLLSYGGSRPEPSTGQNGPKSMPNSPPNEGSQNLQQTKSKIPLIQRKSSTSSGTSSDLDSEDESPRGINTQNPKSPPSQRTISKSKPNPKPVFEGNMQSPSLQPGVQVLEVRDFKGSFNAFINQIRQKMGYPSKRNRFVRKRPRSGGEDNSSSGTTVITFDYDDPADPPTLPIPWSPSKRTPEVTGAWVPKNFDYNLHKDAILERHNLYRQRHHVPDLVYNIEVGMLIERLNFWMSSQEFLFENFLSPLLKLSVW